MAYVFAGRWLMPTPFFFSFLRRKKVKNLSATYCNTRCDLICYQPLQGDGRRAKKPKKTKEREYKMINAATFEIAAKELDEQITDIQLLRRALPTGEGRKKAENAILEKSVIVHKLQADYYYRGISVFIAWDRSGLPIRVCKGCRAPIVSY